MALGCVPAQGGWNDEELARRHPALERDTEQRLSDAPPYFAPAEAALQLFLCRWSRRAPIGVSLPADASAGEQRALRAALAAWEGAGLGLRFTELSSRPAQIEIDFWQAERDEFTVSGAGNTVADCRLTGGLSREPASAAGPYWREPTRWSARRTARPATGLNAAKPWKHRRRPCRQAPGTK